MLLNLKQNQQTIPKIVSRYKKILGMLNHLIKQLQHLILCNMMCYGALKSNIDQGRNMMCYGALKSNIDRGPRPWSILLFSTP